MFIFFLSKILITHSTAILIESLPLYVNMFHQNKFLPEAILKRPHCDWFKEMPINLSKCFSYPGMLCGRTFLRSAVEIGLAMGDYQQATVGSFKLLERDWLGKGF